MAKVTLDIEIDAQGNVTAIGKAEDALDDLEKGGKRAAAQLEKVRRAQDKLANGAIIAGGAIVAGSYVAVQAASNLNEAQNRVTVAFGEQADAIKKWASDSANRIGMSKREALEGAAAFGELMQATGSTAAEASKMSREMVDLAADIASIKNLRPEDALLKLQAGLTGEAEPLKRIGILVDDATVKTKAYEMGLAAAGSELSQQQKVQARYAVIMEQTSSMQGDFARTSDEVANSRRRMNATIEDSIAKIGSGLQPAFKALLGAALPVAETIGEIAETKLGQWAIVAGAGLGALALAAGVTYKGIVAVQGIVQAVNIVLGFYHARVTANTAALTAETGALGANTAAQNVNAAAAGRAGAARATRGGAAGAGGAGGVMAGVGVGGAAVIGATAMAWGGEQLQTAREAKERGTLGTIGQALKTNIKYSNPIGAGIGIAQMLGPMLGIQKKSGDELEKVGQSAAAASDELAGHSLTTSAQAASMSLNQLTASANVLGRAQQGMIAATVAGSEMSIRAPAAAAPSAAGARGRVDRIMLEVKGDSMAAEALAKELSRHPEIVAAINERIERASAP